MKIVKQTENFRIIECTDLNISGRKTYVIETRENNCLKEYFFRPVGLEFFNNNYDVQQFLRELVNQ